MNDNYIAPRKVSPFPCAVLQVLASLLLALSTKTGLLYIGVFLVAVISAMFALQSIVSKSYIYFATVAISVCGAFLIGGVFPAAMSAFALPAGNFIDFFWATVNSRNAVAVNVITFVFWRENHLVER